MAQYTVFVNVMPRDEILDPQGKAVLHGLHNLKFSEVQDVRVGKRIRLQVEAATEAEALEQAANAAKKLLANTVVEAYEVRAD